MNNQDNNIAIKLTNISKKYEIHHEKPTLVEKFIKGKNETFWALKDINLTIKKRERVLLIGPNGSGKTTLLKIITGITMPTTGSVKTYGRVVSLIDLDAGFHDDLTGIQNVYLNGLLLGMSKKEITHNISAIIQFAGIRQFIDVPLFTYSTGMKLRLGCAVAIYANPNIIIFDEGMNTGDEAFQKKFITKLNQLVRSGKTIIMVSHVYDYIKRLHPHIIHIDHGTIKNQEYLQSTILKHK